MNTPVKFPKMMFSYSTLQCFINFFISSKWLIKYQVKFPQIPLKGTKSLITSIYYHKTLAKWSTAVPIILSTSKWKTESQLLRPSLHTWSIYQRDSSSQWFSSQNLKAPKCWARPVLYVELSATRFNRRPAVQP